MGNILSAPCACGAGIGFWCGAGDLIHGDRVNCWIRDSKLDKELFDEATPATEQTKGYRDAGAVANRRLRGATEFEQCLDLLVEWKTVSPYTNLAEMGHFMMGKGGNDKSLFAGLKSKVNEVRHDALLRKLEALVRTKGFDAVEAMIVDATSGDDDEPCPF